MSNPGAAITNTGNLVLVTANIEKYIVASLTITPAIVVPNTTAEQTFTVTGCGVQAGDFVTVNKPTSQAGLGIVGARSTATTDVFAINYVNATAATITPTAGEVYLVKIERPLTLNGVAQTVTTFPY